MKYVFALLICTSLVAQQYYNSVKQSFHVHKPLVFLYGSWAAVIVGAYGWNYRKEKQEQKKQLERLQKPCKETSPWVKRST